MTLILFLTPESYSVLRSAPNPIKSFFQTLLFSQYPHIPFLTSESETLFLILLVFIIITFTPFLSHNPVNVLFAGLLYSTSRCFVLHTPILLQNNVLLCLSWSCCCLQHTSPLYFSLHLIIWVVTSSFRSSLGTLRFSIQSFLPDPVILFTTELIYS